MVGVRAPRPRLTCAAGGEVAPGRSIRGHGVDRRWMRRRQDRHNSIVLYNGQHPQLAAAMVSEFTRVTGISVRQRTDDGVVLTDQILSEGSVVTC